MGDWRPAATRTPTKRCSPGTGNLLVNSGSSRGAEQSKNIQRVLLRIPLDCVTVLLAESFVVSGLLHRALRQARKRSKMLNSLSGEYEYYA